MFEYLEAVGQDPQCDIMGVREEKMGVLNSINNDMLQSEILVVRTTEDILIRVGIEFKVHVILHFVSESMIKEHGLKARCEWNIFKCVSTLMMIIESWFMKIRAQFSSFIVNPCKCTTAVNTAVIHCSLDI